MIKAAQWTSARISPQFKVTALFFAMYGLLVAMTTLGMGM